jgi:hypothetical protein
MMMRIPIPTNRAILLSLKLVPVLVLVIVVSN